MADYILLSIFTNFSTCALLVLLLLSFGTKYKNFTLFNVNVCLWSIFYGLSINAPNSELALLYSKINLFFIVFIPYLGLKVSQEVTGYKLKNSHQFFINLITLLIAISMFCPKVVTGVAPMMDFRYVPQTSVFYYLKLIYFVVLLVPAHIIVYSSIKHNYKNKFILAGFLIGFLGGSTNLLQYIGIPIYPFGNFLIPFYSIITAYALLQHRIYDANLAFNKLATKVFLSISFFLFYLFLCYVYGLIVAKNILSVEIILSLLYFTVSVELYQLFNKKIISRYQEIKIGNIYNKNKILKKINSEILGVVELDQISTKLKQIIEDEMKIKIKSFFISQDLDILEGNASSNFLRCFGEDLDQDSINKFVKATKVDEKFMLSIKSDEVNEAIKDMMKQINCHGFIPFIFQERLIGFLLIVSRTGKNGLFFYEDMEIFDDLVFKVGIAIERAKTHIKSIKDREKALKSLAGSIAHEMRNPISSIRSSVDAIDIDPKYSDQKNLQNLSRQQLEEIIINDSKEIIEHKLHLDKSINLANSVIDMTLADLSGKKISQDDFIYLDAFKTIKDAINIYAFRSQEERKRVKVELDQIALSAKNSNSFIFKGLETAFYYILFNLVKNALYYVKDKSDLTITISSSSALGADILKNSKSATHSNNLNLNPNLTYNILQITDTGPGIPPEILAKLFGSFVTSGKAEGTGLGLAFCKRTMIDFGGDIDCESEVGKFTRFNLYFPKLSEEEELQAKQQFELKTIIPQQQNKESNLNSSHLTINLNSPLISNQNHAIKKILIADDQEINLRISQKLIKDLLPNSIIDLANDGKEALELIKKNNQEKSPNLIEELTNIKDNQQLHQKLLGYKYDLIITDIQMPNLDGFELSKEIRKFDQNIPICAYTSRVSYKIKQEAIDAGIDDYIIKPIPNRTLLKSIYKWLINNHNYNFNQEQITNYFQNQQPKIKVLIADDEAINIMVLKKFLSKHHLEIDTAKDGKELIQKYQSQFPKEELKKFEDNNNPTHIDPTLINQYDIIIADINMPNKRGDEAAKEIRNFELIHSIQNKAIIIANSGDGQPEKLKAMLKSGMDDYFIKGEDNNKLLQIIYFWQQIYKNNQDPDYLNIDNQDYQLADLKKEEQENNKEQESNKNKELANHPIINQKLSKEELIELKEIFINSTNQLLNKIKQANKNQDIQDLAFQTHALKGIAGNVGAQRLFIFISSINNYARKDQWPENKNWEEELEDVVNKTISTFLAIN